MEMFYTVRKNKTTSDCGLDHELLIAKFRLKLKKVEKTTRPFRDDLNQTPYNYTVEVRNRVRGLHLINRGPEELWTEVCDIVQEAVIKTIPKKRRAKRQNGCLRRPYKQIRKAEEAKGKGDKERYTHLNAEFQRLARGDKKAFLSNQCN